MHMIFNEEKNFRQLRENAFLKLATKKIVLPGRVLQIKIYLLNKTNNHRVFVILSANPVGGLYH